MAQIINMLPTRVAIGRADSSGAVHMTPEFARVLADLLARVGGTGGFSTDELAVDLALNPAQGLALLVVELQMQVAALSAQLAAVLATPGPDQDAPLAVRPLPAPEQDVPPAGLVAQFQALAARVDGVELDNAPAVAPADWEHPGAIGRGKSNTGQFTDLTASGKFGCNGKAAQPAIASGGTLAGVIAALVNNGVLAS